MTATLVVDERQLTAADILDRAADELVEHGHVKGTMHAKEGGRCAVGAITWVAVGGDVDSFMLLSSASPMNRATGALLEYINSGTRGAWWQTIFHWNDTPERTADEVISTLRTCAASLREEGACP